MLAERRRDYLEVDLGIVEIVVWSPAGEDQVGLRVLCHPSIVAVTQSGGQTPRSFKELFRGEHEVSAAHSDSPLVKGGAVIDPLVDRASAAWAVPRHGA